ncbi:MAG: hypothetical protein ABS79_00905 [Planctomycetes bacterium SCN 63-9]|nr:MAG: hypothetical protein ABS79_00905 [Planctomycetes bacterium SCN 63-9]
MPALGNRTFYLTASALFFGAIVTESLAKHHVGRGVTAMARSAAMQSERSPLSEAATRHFQRSELWKLVGFVLAALAVGSWAASRMRREPGLQSVPLVLLCTYVLLLFLTV